MAADGHFGYAKMTITSNRFADRHGV